jgi:hypothetical protein
MLYNCFLPKFVLSSISHFLTLNTIVMTQDQEPVRIYVSRAGNSTRLRLRDNRNNPNLTDTDPADIDTDVDPGATIIWELDPKSISTPPDPGISPIGSLVSIEQTFQQPGSNQYQGSVSVLTAEPVKQKDGTITAQVKNPSPGKGKFANYKIVYTLPDGSEHEDDPKILLNS